MAGYGPAEAKRAMLHDQKVAGLGLGTRTKYARVEQRVSLEAVMRAVVTEGPEVMTRAADGYWADMRRRHPWIRGDGERQAGGGRNRLGRWKERTTYLRDGGRVVERQG